jgi:hypothetical protein
VLEKKDIKEILEYMEIQIKKLEDAVDISDQKLTEIAVATDAIRFDFEQLKKKING